ncbi:MAG TPA: acetate--CoA ligase family protein [Acetobacteraceae bacterium]|nr:acetate--CoA ligase family protein [Acetobacteraceae bacterium]
MSLQRLFAPRSIAVVGASASPGKAGHQFLRNLATFGEPVYAINPTATATTILDRPVYPTLAAVAAPIDLVALCIPAAACPDALRAAAACNVGAALIVGGGFAETGTAEAGARQAEILSICRSAGIRLLGPNTAGFANLSRNLAASFWAGLNALPRGNISIVAQSAGVSVILATRLEHLGYGINLSVGVGNSIDVTPGDVIDYLAEDPATAAIALHFEGIADGRRLCEAIRRAVPRKPVVALTVGRTDVAGFARSHTGNMVGSYALKRAALRQSGAVVADTTDDLVDAAIALSLTRLPPTRDPGVGMLTGQGGAGLLMLDELRANGVAVPEFGPATLAAIRALLPPMTFMRNPVDTARPGASFARVLAAVESDPGVDAVSVYLLREAGIDIAAVIGNARMACGKPLIVGSGGLAADLAADLAALRRIGVPAYASPERTAKAMRALVDDARAQYALQRPGATALPPPAPALGPAPLDEAEAKALLRRYGLQTPPTVACASRRAAFDAFAMLPKPLVVKVLNPAVVHKTDLGGVFLNVQTTEELAAALDAIDRIPAPGRSHYLLEAMAPPGMELIVGGLNDASFGPAVMVGIGGVQAQALQDTVLRLAPLDQAEALAMLGSQKSAALLDGWRGAPPVDKASVAAAIVNAGRLLAEHPEITELDINPLRALPPGCLALDAVVLLAPRDPVPHAIAAE